MKIEKEPTKIIAKKKSQPSPEIVDVPKPEIPPKLDPTQPKVKPEPKPEQEEKTKQPQPDKPQTTNPQQPKPEIQQPKSKPKSAPKIKPPKVKKKLADSVQAGRESVISGVTRQQNRIKQGANSVQKRRRIFQIAFIITIVVMFVFVPIYPNQEITKNKQMYLTDKDIKIAHPLGQYFSPFQFLRYQWEVNNGSDYIKSSKVTYKLQDMAVNVKVTEYKPLAKDIENNVYFYENGEVVKKSDINLYAPVVTGFDQKKLESLLKNIAKLDYQVITQIDTIEYVGTKDDPDLLKMGMDGDNTVYIDIEQIKNKLPYYDQIKQIIDEKAGGKPGIIHLDIGDYYEPK